MCPRAAAAATHPEQENGGATATRRHRRRRRGGPQHRRRGRTLPGAWPGEALTSQAMAPGASTRAPCGPRDHMSRGGRAAGERAGPGRRNACLSQRGPGLEDHHQSVIKRLIRKSASRNDPAPFDAPLSPLQQQPQQPDAMRHRIHNESGCPSSPPARQDARPVRIASPPADPPLRRALVIVGAAAHLGRALVQLPHLRPGPNKCGARALVAIARCATHISIAGRQIKRIATCRASLHCHQLPLLAAV